MIITSRIACPGGVIPKIFSKIEPQSQLKFTYQGPPITWRLLDRQLKHRNKVQDYKKLVKMSHGVSRQKESPEKEAARLEKEKSQVAEYCALVEDVMTRVSISTLAADPAAQH